MPSYTVPQSPQSLSPVNSYNVWPGGAFPLNKAGGGFHGDDSTRGRRRTRKARNVSRKGRNVSRKGRNVSRKGRRANRKCGSWRR